MYKDWSERQKRIYDGLKEIGSEAAGYFESALRYYYDESLQNRVSHLAHDAREIDGGLRDIFSPGAINKEKSLIQKGHIASILVALNVDEKNTLAREWISVATKFSKYAHRHGIWKKARNFEEFKPLWERYEEVLSKLVGSFYAIINRIDRLIQLKDVNDASCGALLNLIRIKPYEDYFFKRVKNLKWFIPLNSKKVFNANNIQFDEKGSALFWNALIYLEQVSLQLQNAPQYGKELIVIIDNTVKFSLKCKVNNDYIWWSFAKILNNIPSDLIVANVSVEQFKTWLLEWVNPEARGDLDISDIAEKLLPKFLDNKDTIKFSEIIIEVITRIQAGGKAHPFTKREDAVLTYSSYWLLEAFKKYSKKIGAECSTDVIYNLADKLKMALEYKQKNSYRNIEIGGNIYQIYVSREDKKNLQDKEIGFKENCFYFSIKQFASEQIKGIDIKKDFWALYNIEPQVIIPEFPIEADDKQTFIQKIKDNLPASIRWQEAEDLEKNIKYLFDGLYEDYSQVWCRSLEYGPEHPGDAEEVLTIILRDALLSKCETNKLKGKAILEDFLSDKYRFPIFKKFALFCIDKLWEDYKDIFDKVLNNVPDILEKTEYEVEIQDLLKNHNVDFDESTNKRIEKLINNVPEYYKKEGGEFEAIWKFKWLSPLKDNPYFSDYYNQERQKAGKQEPFVPERSAIEGGVVVHKSPLGKEEILSSPNTDLVKYLNEFQGADFWRGPFEGKPDKEGLAEALHAAVKENPMKFAKEMNVFYNAPYFYIHNILGGLKDAWNEGKDLLWGKIFDLCLEYVDKPKFLQEAFESQGSDSGNGKFIWVIEDIVNLIDDGCKDDPRAFGIEDFDKVNQIFNKVIPIPKSEKYPDTQRDAVNYALNTTFGRIIMSFIVFSLKVVRTRHKKEENWGNNKYEPFFEKGIEAYIWFGRYLPNIRYLDQNYVDKIKIPAFSRYSGDEYEWKKFMEGYLTCPYVYDEIYHLMRPNYLKAIEKKVFPDQIDKRLVQHITIGYLRCYEELREKNINGEESLFWKMLNDAGISEKHGRWLEVASFFWAISGRRIRKEEKEAEEAVSEEFKKRILGFWEWSCNEQEYVKARLGQNYGSFLGRMAELTILLDRIDDTNELWLMLSVSHVSDHYHPGFFIEYLTKFEDDDSVRRIGRVFLKILENSTPTFRQEDIHLIVKRLYELWKKNPQKYEEVKTDANNICETYGRRGIHFLKDTWTEYNR